VQNSTFLKYLSNQKSDLKRTFIHKGHIAAGDRNISEGRGDKNLPKYFFTCPKLTKLQCVERGILGTLQNLVTTFKAVGDWMFLGMFAKI